MAANLGNDLDCVGDMGPGLAVVSGRVALAQALARRLMTPRGGLRRHPEYGYDLRQHLNEAEVSAGQVAFQVESEVLKDERIFTAKARVWVVGDQLFVSLFVTDNAGPFALTVGVSALTVELLRGEGT